LRPGFSAPSAPLIFQAVAGRRGGFQFRLPRQRQQHRRCPERQQSPCEQRVRSVALAAALFRQHAVARTDEALRPGCFVCLVWDRMTNPQVGADAFSQAGDFRRVVGREWISESTWERKPTAHWNHLRIRSLARRRAGIQCGGWRRMARGRPATSIAKLPAICCP